MAESIDIVRQKLELYSAKVGDEIDLHAFVEFAAETADGEFANRDYSTSVIRKTVEELHRKTRSNMYARASIESPASRVT